MVCGTCGLSGHNSATCGRKKEEVNSLLPLKQGQPATEKIPQEDLSKMHTLKHKIIEVAKGLMKGRAENIYQYALTVELQNEGIKHSTVETIPIIYKGVSVGYERLDIALHSWLNIIIELKAISANIKPEHYFQVLNYMRYKNYKYGVVVNYCQSSGSNVQVMFVLYENDEAWIFDIDTNLIEPLNDYKYEP
jgi:GxxExxY protein